MRKITAALILAIILGSLFGPKAVLSQNGGPTVNCQEMPSTYPPDQRFRCYAVNTPTPISSFGRTEEDARRNLDNQLSFRERAYPTCRPGIDQYTCYFFENDTTYAGIGSTQAEAERQLMLRVRGVEETVSCFSTENNCSTAIFASQSHCRSLYSDRTACIIALDSQGEAGERDSGEECTPSGQRPEVWGMACCENLAVDSVSGQCAPSQFPIIDGGGGTSGGVTSGGGASGGGAKAGTSPTFGRGLIDPALGGIIVSDSAFGQKSLTNLELIISRMIGLLTVIASVAFVLYFILGAVNWIVAGGDASKIQKARDQMVQGVIGLVVVILAYSIMGIVGTVLGINILNPAVQLRATFGL